jgi:L-threonylcarbamoyladenylate synthase
MIYLKKRASEFTSSDFDLISVYLHAGKVVVLPTDTIYGLSCLAADPDAIKNIFRLKKRDINKPMITLAASMAMVKSYALITKKEESLLKALWFESANPTTVILNAKNNLPKEIISSSGGISVRLPKSDFLIKIIKKVRGPIVSTSLNLSGQDIITDLENLNLIFTGKYKPGLVVDIGKSKRKKPSRLIDLRSGELKIIRK